MTDTAPESASPALRPKPNDDELRQLISEHAPAIYRVAISIVRDPALAEDVVQETIIRVWNALPKFRGDSPIRTWILRIAHNTAVSLLRKIKDEAWDPDTMPEGEAGADVTRTVVAREELVMLGDALRDLDELSRTIIVLREVEGLSYEEIAETLEVSLSVVKTRLLRARRRLQETIRGGEQ